MKIFNRFRFCWRFHFSKPSLDSLGFACHGNKTNQNLTSVRPNGGHYDWNEIDIRYGAVSARAFFFFLYLNQYFNVEATTDARLKNELKKWFWKGTLNSIWYFFFTKKCFVTSLEYGHFRIKKCNLAPSGVVKSAPFHNENHA